MIVSRKEYKKMLDWYAVGELVSVDDRHLLLELISDHPNARKKIGVGIRWFTVMNNGRGGKCFQLIRTDGSREDFSYRKCFGLDEHKNQTEVFRKEVEYQRVAFLKKEFLGKQLIPCELSGGMISHHNAHVQYISPLKYLVDDFLSVVGLDLLSVAMTSRGTFHHITDRGLAQKWKAYHAQNARLRIYDRRLNNLQQKWSKEVFSGT